MTKSEGNVAPGPPSPQPKSSGALSEGAGSEQDRGDGRQAVHRDRRGARRTVNRSGPASPEAQVQAASPNRPPAEAKLRLSLHPIRRTALLSIVLTRPDGFPARVTVDIDGQPTLDAYDLRRYDDLDLPWTEGLLAGEFRVASAEGFRWLRSARFAHIFSEDPSEPDLVSVNAARAGAVHTLVCRSSDVETIRAATSTTGSPELAAHHGWKGIPDGWCVLSGYAPAHASSEPLPVGLRPLNPGAGLQIGFAEGLAIRAKVFAEGHPPRISIGPEPIAAEVSIDGQPARLVKTGGWQALGWDTPGRHLVDVVPGPSASYDIVADPWSGAGWAFWDAHSERSDLGSSEQAANARICGADVRGPRGETVLAAETRQSLIALGMTSGAVPLRPRDDVQLSIAYSLGLPSFLISATGQRRTQGRVIWLGPGRSADDTLHPEPGWVSAVRWASARRLPLDKPGPDGEAAWRMARERARRFRKTTK